MLDIWYALAPFDAPLFLDEEETQRRNRFLCEHARQTYARAHSLKRRVLSHYAPARPPLEWRFAQSASGKPAVAQPFPYRFNLSHSGACVAVAVCSREVGVDIECPRPLAAAALLIERVFHQREQAWLAAQRDFETAFFRLWTLKEALLKAAGTGFRHPPEQVAWDALDEPWASAMFMGRRWRGCAFRAGDAMLAVAVAGDADDDANARTLRIEPCAASATLHWTAEPLPADDFIRSQL